MEQTIYAYWNGRQLYDIFNAVVLVTGGSEGNVYRQLLTSVAIMALLVSVGIGLARLRATDSGLAFMGLTFFYGMFFLPTTTVYIEDVRYNQHYTVDNVPLGLAVFGGVTSGVGYWLTNAYETYFTAVDDEKFSKYGFLFGSRLVAELPKQHYRDPATRQNTKDFILNCVNPELDANPALIGALINAPDLWLFVRGQTSPALSLNPGRVTPYFKSSTGETLVLPCIVDNNYTDPAGAVGLLEIDSLAATLADIVLLGKKMHPGAENAYFTPLEISQWETVMTGISRQATETIRHYALTNMFREANEDRAGVFAATLAAKQLETSYDTMRILAEGALPKIRNLIEATIYAVFPIVFLLVIGAGAQGGKVLSMYGMTAIWVQLWAPLYAVINSFMHKNAAEATLRLTDSAGAAMVHIPHLLSMSTSDQRIAGLMTISVPAIALAIVRGGAVAMSGVVNSLMSPGQSTAGRVGGEAGAGSISGGNVNWDTSGINTYTSNKIDTAPTSRTGASMDTRLMEDGSQVTTFGNGTQAVSRQPTVSHLGAAGAAASTAYGQTLSTASRDHAEQAVGFTAQFISSLNAAHAAAKNFLRSNTSTSGVHGEGTITDVNRFN